MKISQGWICFFFKEKKKKTLNEPSDFLVFELGFTFFFFCMRFFLEFLVETIMHSLLLRRTILSSRTLDHGSNLSLRFRPSYISIFNIHNLSS